MSNAATVYSRLLSIRKHFFNLITFLIFGQQRAIRQAIIDKWGGAVPAGIYWRYEDPNDAAELGMGKHGSREWAAKRAFHSLLSGYAADRLHFDRTFKYLPGLLLLIPLVSLSFRWAAQSPLDVYPLVSTLWSCFAVLLFFLPVLSSSFVWRWLLPSKIVTDEEENAALGILERCLLRVPSADNVPEDVADRYRVGDIDSEGDSVVGQIVATDMETCALHVQVLETCIVFALASLFLLVAVNLSGWLSLVGAGVLLLISGLLMGFSRTWLVCTVVVVPVVVAVTVKVFGSFDWETCKSILLSGAAFFLIVYELKQPAPYQIRAKVMDKAAKQSATEYLRDSAGREYWQMIEEARQEQQATASADKSPLISFGYSTGVLAARRDPFAPSVAGMPVCLSLEDLSMHLFVPGASGTGKTSSIIRPTIKQWLDLEAGGMLVLDGKGQLADELNGAAGYTVLSPESCDYNAIDGLLPEEVADTFFTLFANKGDGKDSVFDNNARSAIYYAGVLLHETEEPYTLTNIDRLLTDEEERRAIASKALEAGSKTAINAVDYWVREYAGYSDRIQSSILVTCKAWLSPVLQNRYLTRWNECTTGERIESVLQGAKFGLSLPDAKYGKAGAVMSMLAIRRLYQAAKLRGDQWKNQPGQTQVLFVADEVQNLASANDIEFIPIARSLGVTALWATQNIDGLERLGKDKMEQLLGNFSNILAFPSRTKKSDEWLSNRAGKVWRTVVERFNGFPDSRFSVDSITHSGTAKKTHSTPDEPYIRRNISFGRTGHIAGSEDQAIFNNIAHSSIKNLFGTPVVDEPAIKEPYADVQIMPTKIVDEAEIDSLLAKRGTVLAIFRRAGVVRRDVIKTQHLQNFGGQL